MHIIAALRHAISFNAYSRPPKKSYGVLGDTLFTESFKINLLSTYCVLGTVLGILQ